MHSMLVPPYSPYPKHIYLYLNTTMYRRRLQNQTCSSSTSSSTSTNNYLFFSIDHQSLLHTSTDEMTVIYKRIKQYANGTSKETGAHYKHHCGECHKAPDANCLAKKHLTYCEVPLCGHLFWTGGTGCSTHCYNDGYNAAIWAEVAGATLEQIINLIHIRDDLKPPGFDFLPAAKKLDQIRKVYGHDMTLCPVDTKDEEKKEDKKSAKWSKLMKKYSKHR